MLVRQNTTTNTLCMSLLARRSNNKTKYTCYVTACPAKLKQKYTFYVNACPATYNKSKYMFYVMVLPATYNTKNTLSMLLLARRSTKHVHLMSLLVRQSTPKKVHCLCHCLPGGAQTQVHFGFPGTLDLAAEHSRSKTVLPHMQRDPSSIANIKALSSGRSSVWQLA